MKAESSHLPALNTNELFPCRVLKKVKDYTIFPLVWMNEVRSQKKKERSGALQSCSLMGFEMHYNHSLSFLSPYQTASLDDPTADRIKEELLSRIQMLEVVWRAMLGSGVSILALCSIVLCVAAGCRNMLLWMDDAAASSVSFRARCNSSCCGASNLLIYGCTFFGWGGEGNFSVIFKILLPLTARGRNTVI